ncbi:MAG: YidC/Oxa1 family membrane protein insertase [Trueperaceae bacterium]|nr:YidC/Oxa1 family membrane protein insertase [Trueperaceae bacterium]
MTLRVPFALLAALALSTAHAVEFGVHDFTFAEFRDAETVAESCDGASPSFWCGLQDAALTRVPTKGVDLFFTEAGEIVAAYAKPQKGQTFSNYDLDQRQNLIPDDAPRPGAALRLDGAYLPPEAATATWERVNEDVVRGTFTHRAGPLEVERTVEVSNLRHTVLLDVRATRVTAADAADADAIPLQLSFPGVAGVDDPVLKVGQGYGEDGSSATNPLSQAVGTPSYASLQNNDRNTAFAIVLTPQRAADGAPLQDDLQALPLPPREMALQVPLGGAAGATASLDVRSYLGPNELVRYEQEGYVEMPGLFDPNILGRLSLGILWVLQTLHDYLGNWGLSIIALTLLFRALVWPLINTQTKSMYGMQELQPKIQELQKKHKDDRETLTQETMKLYREAGVNPAGGCLPILLQMPLFIILWRVFVNFEFGEGFLWVPDLGQRDPTFILPILYVMVMFAMSWFSARGNPQSLRQQILINVVFAFILFGFPAGVLLYFVVSMGVQVLQYWLIQRGRGAAAGASG